VRFVGGAAARVEAVHCGACESCDAGWTYWCRTPRPSGEPLVALGGPAGEQTTLRWLSLVNALAVADPRPEDVVLVLSEADPGAVRTLVGCLHAGAVAVSADGRDAATRDFLNGASETGRAQIVLAEHRARDAVKAAQRGGTVCLPAGPVLAPSVTELVQRDVRLVAARTAEDFRSRTTDHAIAAPLAALGTEI
jgi:hypothetical protein